MAKSIVLEKGTTLQGGKYVIQRKLGQGGFGITYEATLVKLKKRVALKESFLSGVCGRGGDGKTVVVPLDENVSFFEKQKERFMDEALRLANLSNPHIVPVFDSFEENGTYYYVMDFIEGESLSDKLKRGGKPFDEGSVMTILDQLLDALDCIHSEVPPLCHLDIKPANIMMNKKGKVILVDFGASKYASTSDVSVSSSSVAYTPGYAPFEQVYNDRKNMGPWTDFYAVGATLFCLFTGERPSPPTDIFQDSTPDKHASIPLPGSLSPMMKKLILWMMSLPKNDRPESVNQIRDFISQYKVTDGYGKTGGHGGQHEHHEMDELEDGDELIVISASQSPVDSSDPSAHSDYSEKTTPPAASREETALPDNLQVFPADMKVVEYKIKDIESKMPQNSMTPKQMYDFGVNYFYGTNGKAKDYAEAVKWFHKAAEQGNASAQCYLGFMYEKGYGVSKDYSEALKWFRKAVEQGNAQGQSNLGYMYQYGYGVSQDYAEAVKWYRKSAEQGNAAGQYNLGFMYEKGYGVSKDYPRP